MAKKKDDYTKRQHQFIVDNLENNTYAEITEMFNKKFKTNKKKTAISTYCNRNGLSNNLAIVKTQFKPGHTPVRSLPIGSESPDARGEMYIKVQMKGKKSECWKQKKVYIWEQHYGKLPKGNLVIFLDGNIRNFDIENLVSVTRGEFLSMGRQKYFSNDPEITMASLMYLRLVNKRRTRQQELTGKVPRH